MWKGIKLMWTRLDPRYRVAIIGGLFVLAAAIIPSIIDHCFDEDGVIRVEISLVKYDAPGDDNYNLNGEWVKISNTGDLDVDMSGWKLKDENKHVYYFPDEFLLKKDKSVTVYTGLGEDTTTELYWECSRSIWTNTGDCAYLIDESENEVAKYCW